MLLDGTNYDAFVSTPTIHIRLKVYLQLQYQYFDNIESTHHKKRVYLN